ncbi:MAG TPA: aminopeptidase [Actinomycetota bacterium]|nr:aminopeptidase [Actinomycetota bacterium]
MPLETQTSTGRVGMYADLIIDWCIRVQPGWQVLVNTSPLARPLVEALARRLARKGAYYLGRIGFTTASFGWLQEASMELASTVSELEKRVAMEADAFITISAPENTREGSEIPPDKQFASQKAMQPVMERVVNMEVAWLACVFPVPALAQDAGMSLSAYEDFVYGACLLDWKTEGERMKKYADRLNDTKELRIVGEGTDIMLSLEGREAVIDDGRVNMPGGEFFYGPREDATEGVVTFSEFPVPRAGRDLKGVRLEFKGGRIVDASAETEEQMLIEALDIDEGARVLGELGIGCNPGIDRFMRNVLFDEKIQGTVHLAPGRSIPSTGGINHSSLHWDMVKDLRNGGKIYCDGELVQENGNWLVS